MIKSEKIFSSRTVISTTLRNLSQNSQEPVTAQTFRGWLTEVGDYKKLAQDPRKQYSWEEKITEITQTVENELGSKLDSSSTESPEKPKKNFLSVECETQRYLEAY